MPQKEIFQGWLCLLYSTKQEWLRHKRAYCGEALLWVRSARAEKTHVKLTPSASHEEVSKKRSIKGKAIRGMYREQAGIQKLPVNKAGKSLKDPEERNPFSCGSCRDLVSSMSMGSLVLKLLNLKNLLQNNLSSILNLETQFHTIKLQHLNGQGL